jgi:hypothetical protein
MGQMGVHEFDPGTDILKDAGFQLPVVIGNVFATLTPPTGKYRVNINRIAYGTGQPTIANNSSFFVGNVNHTLSSGAILGVPYRYEFYVLLDGLTAIGVKANGNGSANIGVSVGITATKLA